MPKAGVTSDANGTGPLLCAVVATVWRSPAFGTLQSPRGIVVQEIEVRGSRYGWFNLAIDLLEHELDLTHHISAEYLLDRT